MMKKLARFVRRYLLRVLKMREIIVGETAFESPIDRGFKVKASYLTEPKGEALIEIFKDGKKLRWFILPAYRIRNIQAHLVDMVDSELRGEQIGYDASEWTGFVAKG